MSIIGNLENTEKQRKKVSQSHNHNYPRIATFNISGVFPAHNYLHLTYP